MNDDIAAFVRDEYTPDGVEVEGEGANRMRLRMPPTFHNVTDLCRELVECFGAHIDLVIDHNDSTKCVVFEVYTSPSLTPHGVAPATDPCGAEPTIEKISTASDTAPSPAQADVVLVEPWTPWIARNVAFPLFFAVGTSLVMAYSPSAMSSTNGSV
jgi:hypothetical protein